MNPDKTGYSLPSASGRIIIQAGIPIKPILIYTIGIMLIRPITDAHLPALLQVYQQCEDFLSLGPTPVASLEMIAADRALSVSQNGQFCGLFDESGCLLGVVDFVPGNFNHQSDHAFIELLMIAAPFRGAGLGAQAVLWLENELRRAGIAVLGAAVQVNNPAAIRFWERCGFSRIGSAQPQSDGTVTFPLEKSLEPWPK